MKQLWSVLFVAMTTATLAINPTFADVTIMGEGLNSCGSWVVAERNDAYFVDEERCDQASGRRRCCAGVDGDAVQVWMDNYCKAHPTEDIGSAAATLMFELEHLQAK